MPSFKKVSDSCIRFIKAQEDPESKRSGEYGEAKVEFIKNLRDYIDGVIAEKIKTE